MSFDEPCFQQTFLLKEEGPLIWDNEAESVNLKMRRLRPTQMEPHPHPSRPPVRHARLPVLRCAL